MYHHAFPHTKSTTILLYIAICTSIQQMFLFIIQRLPEYLLPYSSSNTSPLIRGSPIPKYGLVLNGATAEVRHHIFECAVGYVPVISRRQPGFNI